MNDEPINEEIAEGSNLPATKGDIVAVKQEMHNTAKELRKEMKEMRCGLQTEMQDMGRGLRSEIKDMRDGLQAEMKETKDEIMRHFDVAVENIADEIRGANADEISLIKTKLGLHDEKLDAIEERVGLR